MMEKVNKAGLRDEMVTVLRSLLMGPEDSSSEEVIKGRLNLRYFTGILFPKGAKRSALAEDSEDSSDEDSSGSIPQGGGEFSGDSDNPLSLANEDLPSSVGISFTVRRGSTIVCEASAGRYEPIENDVSESQSDTKQKRKSGEWKRIPIPFETIEFTSSRSEQRSVFDGLASLRVLRRPSRFNNNVEIVTVSLVNEQEKAEKERQESEAKKRLYQVSLSVRTPEDVILPYDAKPARELVLEDQILELQYSDSPVFAVGHGASCGWAVNPDDPQSATEVYVDYLPTGNILRPRFDTVAVNGRDFDDPDLFKLSTIANPSSDRGDLISRLRKFVQFYGQWIEQQTSIDAGDLVGAKEFLISEMRICASRMQYGLDLLEADDGCWEAFRLANLAMLTQRSQLDELRKIRSSRRREGAPWPVPAHEQIELDSVSVFDCDARWRPFQLAFGLMILPDLEPDIDLGSRIVDPSNVDLIWFSTGGGKTEAYMLVTAYELIRRRMRFGSLEKGLGTGVFTRYTLRFLTADQFLRTVSLVCALEKVRIQNQSILGSGTEHRFTVGLYIGSESGSYSKVELAAQDLDKLKTNSEFKGHKFQLGECPECGTALIPSESDIEMHSPDSPYSLFGIATPSHDKLVYRCVNHNCIFNIDDGIPVVTVDDQIYKYPPSILLGTVDKFAMLAFRAEGSSLFGKDKKVVPPTLIIQDELHLISGPLGTIVSLYEAAFETVIKQRFKSFGLGSERTCKYIASSATVRDSDVQIRHLSGSNSKIFPPRGIRSTDSFFATVDKNPNMARRYIGLMGQALRSTSAAHWACAAILQSTRYLAKKHQSRELLDFLWSLLVYSNSKRELGLINAAVNSEIYDRMKAYAEYQGQDPEEVQDLIGMEISSTVVENIVDMRDELATPVSDLNTSIAKDIVPCTNMISVGVDIDRLGLMLVNGQPKTTSEYIQASSRVGRNPNEMGPGLVIALYSPAKPRDRSHYENFVGYHNSVYRFVEPTSVTPGSEKALERAVHAAIVISLRHSNNKLRQNNSAAKFRSDAENEAAILSELRSRLLDCYKHDTDAEIERAQIASSFDEFIAKWDRAARTHFDLQFYNKRGEQPARLLKYFSDLKPDPATPTMTSMRGVDVEIPLKQVGGQANG